MIGARNRVRETFAAAMAGMRQRLASRSELIETCAGFALIGGLLLAGAALPAML